MNRKEIENILEEFVPQDGNLRIFRLAERWELITRNSRFGVVFEDEPSWFIVYPDGSSNSGWLEELISKEQIVEMLNKL
jgi:hypothetical protein